MGGVKSQISLNGRQSKARNFEKDQQIDKQATEVSSTISALQNCTKLRGITPRGFHAT